LRNLLKAILKTGTGSLVSVLFGIVAIKLIAARLGVEALGSFSLVKQTIVAGSAMFITGGQTALVQGMSTRTGGARRRFLSTALVLLCGGSVIAGTAMIVSSRWFAPKVLPGIRGPIEEAVGLAGTAVLVAGPVSFVFGALNGLRRIGRLAVAQSANAVALAGLVWLAMPLFRVDRPQTFALVLACSQLPGLLLGGVFLVRERLDFRAREFDTGSAGQFAKLAFATFAAATLQGWTVLALRGSVSARLGLRSAGLFDVGWTISMVYVMLVLGAFSTYYLPTLASEQGDRRKLINEVLRTSLLLVVPLISALMALGPLVITILYSPEFVPATHMMRWMLLGDFCKVLSFVVAMPMIAFADTRAFIAGELGWNLAMLGGTQAVLRSGIGMEWLGAVFAASYVGYLAYAWWYCDRKLGWKFPARFAAPLLFSIVVLVAMTVVTWSAAAVSGSGLAVATCGSCVLALMLLRPSRKDSVTPSFTGVKA
jgi:PST family polysaccharide transporter